MFIEDDYYYDDSDNCFKNTCSNILNSCPEKEMNIFLDEIVKYNNMIISISKKKTEYRKKAIIRYLFKKNRKKYIKKIIYFKKSEVAVNKQRTIGGRFEKKIN